MGESELCGQQAETRAQQSPYRDEFAARSARCGHSTARFAAGAVYMKNPQLPGSTMTLRGEAIVVADSTFAGLQSFGDAAIVIAASNVTFINTTFVTSNNSAGETLTPHPLGALTTCSW